MLVVSIIALLVSAAALGVSIYFSSKQSQLQRRLGAIEEARRREELALQGRAEVTAWFEPRVNSAGRTTWHFVIRNLGPARARNVEFDIGPPPGAEGRQIVKVPMEGHPFPLATLHSKQMYHLPIQPMMNDAPIAEVSLRWEDGSGAREKVLTLNVF